jgi:7-cyano-7-deazaguanine synthase
MSKAILLSGGIDSIALTYWQRPQHAFTINYGQKPALAEIKASKAICEHLQIAHSIISVDCSQLGSGDLSQRDAIAIAPSSEWWPFRNQMLITLACMKGISLGIEELMAGSILSDGFHKDGTKDFYHRVNDLICYQEGNISVTAPAIDLTSVELILKSKVPRDLLYYAHSCHKSNMPCGNCRGCNKYIQVIETMKHEKWHES